MRQHLYKITWVVALPLIFQAWAAMSAQSLAAQKKASHVPGQGRGTSMKATYEDVELQLDDSVLVRRFSPPDQYDDNGKARKPTVTELSELKGDPKLPGYKADIADVKPGKVVQVRLLKKKDDSKPADKDKDAENKTTETKPGSASASAVKPGWVVAGTLTGTVTSYKPASKKSVEQKLVVRVESTTLAKHHQGTTKGKKVTLPDTEVDMIMIMSKDPPPSAQADKKKQE